MSNPLPTTKLKGALGGGGSSAAKYLALNYGPVSKGRKLLQEVVTTLFMGLPGAAGLALRSVFYRGFFAECGRKVVIGRNVNFRHACKIRLGDGVVIDDGALVDAKGDGNDGIQLDAGVYVGRNTLIYCKGGAIHCGLGVNLGANCSVFSSNRLSIGAGTMIGAYSYFLSGGEYDLQSQVPFCEQDGMCTKGPLTIGENCWIGARVTVLDAACVGARCVLGAGTVVTKTIPDHSLVLGVPGRVVRTLESRPETQAPPVQSNPSFPSPGTKPS